MISVQQTAEKIATHFCVPVAKMLGRDRHPRFVFARHAFFYTLKFNKVPIVEIARVTGFDVSNVSYGIRKTEERLKAKLITLPIERDYMLLQAIETAVDQAWKLMRPEMVTRLMRSLK